MAAQKTSDVEAIEKDSRELLEDYESEMREAHDVAYEDDNVIVFVDETGHELNEIVAETGVSRDVVSQWHHEQARKVCDRPWSVWDPVVALKN